MFKQLVGAIPGFFIGVVQMLIHALPYCFRRVSET